MESKPVNILIIDDDRIYADGCEQLLTNAGYSVKTTHRAHEGLELALSGKYHVVFVDYRMPEMNGLEFLQVVRAVKPNLDIVMVTGYASIEMAVKVIQNGAYDYIQKPFPPEKLLAVIDKIVKKQSILAHPRSSALNLEFDGHPLPIIGKSSKMRDVFQLVLKVADTDSTVLILGESGTGKELIAKAIHANSGRRQKPFFAMDCGSLVETLFESELFGHVKGSFTGALATKHGAFELADEGTFFFDEIGNISLNVQAKILRAIQEKEIRRVGATDVISVDVRVVAATNLDLRRAVEEGRFREDLFYRISVFPIHLPPLRDRKSDIPLLVDFFISKVNARRRKTPLTGATPEVMEIFGQYHWPGNVRELENAVERAAIVEESDKITLSSLPAQIEAERTAIYDSYSLEDMEKKHISRILSGNRWNISLSARILGIDRKSLYNKIKKYELKKNVE